MARPYLKVFLTNKPDAWLACEIINRWKSARKCARHLPRAILLYESLIAGDAEKFFELLREYFPGRTIQFGMVQQQMPTLLPVSSPIPNQREYREVRSVISVQEMIDNSPDEFGLDEMDFS